MTEYFIQALIYLSAAVIAVPLAKRLGLGSVLGYLIAGVVIGPITQLVGEETNAIQHFAEFGVVMMLFLVGLELDPRALWDMRSRLFNLGGLQVLGTAGIFTGISLLLDIDWRTAVAIGLILSLSSTAIVLQTFSEKGLAKTNGGRAAFSVLLFQDIAVIPMLALIPLLALPELIEAGTVANDAEHHAISLVDGLAGWSYAAVVLGAIAAVILGGKFVVHPLFHWVAKTGLREMLTATALLLVISIAALMSLVGLSPALGVFLAGVVLANSEFRHELESNIEPFKGLLLGLFFITVGAGINFAVITDNIVIVSVFTLAVMVIKSSVLFILAKLFGVNKDGGWLLTLSLAQAGEFGFVLTALTVQSFVLPEHIASILLPVIALTMFLTPLLFIIFEKIILPIYQDSENTAKEDSINEQAPVIIAGIGRFGQIVNRFLKSNGINTIVLDHSSAIIEKVKSIKMKAYYGDATRPDLLHTAGIDAACMLIIAIDDKEKAVELVRYVKHHRPALKVFARAYDRGHRYELQAAGADEIVVETYYSALTLAAQALQQTGVHPFKVEQNRHKFREIEHRNHQELYTSWLKNEDEAGLGIQHRDLFIQLEQALDKEMLRTHHTSDDIEAWRPPPKEYGDSLKGDK